MKTFAKLGLVASAACAGAFAQVQTNALKTPAPSPRVGLGSTGHVNRPTQRSDRTLQDLTPDQRTKLDEANKEFSATVMPLYTRMVAARRELDNAVNQDKMDEAAVRAKSKEIADLETDIAIARAQRYVKFRTFLSAEQARRLNQPTPLGRPYQPVMHEGQPAPAVTPNK
jgi:Spy/CpxP family protein refolding chaperone